MEILLDTANLENIQTANKFYTIDGVTTNPTIISKERTQFIPHLQKIKSIIGEKMLHVQAVSLDAETIVKEAKYINEKLGENIYVKIPVIPEGIRAIKMLKAEGIKTTATAIFTVQQAHMAAKAGASYVAPYINRIDNIAGNGVRIVEEIVNAIYDYDAKVIAASFKNVQQVNEVCNVGCQSVTVNMETLENMLKHPLTDWSIDQFIKDWENQYGKGNNIMQEC